MRDYFAEILEVHGIDGDVGAFNRGVQLIEDINVEIKWLNEQADHVVRFLSYLNGKIGEERQLVITMTLSKVERPTKIREAALLLVGKGMARFDGEGVLTELQYMGFNLGVQQPLAVIGTVLSKSKDFRRVDKNLFQHTKQGIVPTDIEPVTLVENPLK